MVKQESVTINGREIQEGDTINRIGNVQLSDLHGKSPETLLQEAAAEIIRKIPGEVDTDNPEVLAAELESDPSLFDAIDGLSLYSMGVNHVLEGSEQVESEITLTDWGTGSRETFSPAELSEHLGTTIFLTS